MTRRTRLLVGWTVAALAMALFARLGSWQAGRAGEKVAMLEASRAALDAPRPGPLSLAHDASRSRGYDRVQGRGRFTGPVLWLDNQQRGGRVGVRAYRLFEPAQGAPLLVDAGWLPMPADRARLPSLDWPQGTVEVRGLLAPPPSAGIAMGEAMAAKGADWLMLRVDMAAISRALSLRAPPAPRVLRLDPALPYGAERDLELLANTLTPDKHRGYALQWFGLAITVGIIALVLTFRGNRR